MRLIVERFFIFIESNLSFDCNTAENGRRVWEYTRDARVDLLKTIRVRNNLVFGKSTGWNMVDDPRLRRMN